MIRSIILGTGPWYPKERNSSTFFTEKFRINLHQPSKTIISFKFILTLIIVPILTHQISKSFVVGPIVDHFRSESQAGVFLNFELEEEAFGELKRFEEELKFKNLIGLAPKISSEEMEEAIQHKAVELAEEFRDMGNNAIKNIFSDLLSIVAFCLVMFNPLKVHNDCPSIF